MTPLTTAPPVSSPDLVEILPVLIGYIDADGIYRRMSRAYEEWCGIRREDHLNRHYSEVLLDLFGEDYAQKAIPKMEEALSGRRGHLETRITVLNGERDVRVTYTPHRDESGDVRGVVVMVNDITDLRRAEQQAVASEERLRLAADAGNLGFWEIDFLTGAHIWSAGCFPLLGFANRASAPCLDEFLERIHPDDRQAHSAAFEAARAGCTGYHCEYRVQTGEGKWKWIHSSGRFIPDENGLAIRALGVIFDLTSLKEAEEEAAQQARRVDQILESTKDGVLMIDRNWRLTYFNSRAAAMVGLGKELLGKDAWEVFPHARGTPIGDAYVRAMSERIHSSYEEYYPEPLNRWFQADVYPTDEGVAGFFRDVTERRQTDESLRLQQQAIRTVPIGITIARYDPAEGHSIVYVNPAFEKTTGFSKEEILGGNFTPLHGPDTDQQALARIEDALGRGESAQAVLRNYRKDGTPFTNEVSISPVRDTEGKITHVVGIQNDVTERVLAAERLTRQAQYDALTGIPNRHLFLELLRQALRSANRLHGRPVALVYLDVDSLKHINERLGHHCGDRFLRQIAQRIRSIVRDSDLAARIGGDEFVLLIADFKDRSDVEKLIDRILKKVATPVRVGGREIVATVSAGYAIAPLDATDPEDLLRKADLAMYSAKRQCRNTWKAWIPSMDSGNKQILDIAAGLRQALKKDEFVLMYQPRIHASTGRLQSMEALIRWQHPERGLIPPGAFIPVAEETGIIVDIGQWVLREAVRQIAAWRHEGYEVVPVSVNVSAAQLRNPAFPQIVSEALEDQDVAPDLLEIELTESIFMDESVSKDLLPALRSLGVRVAIDDFGTGYSGLGYLGRFAVDILKIDRGFTNCIGENATSASICRSILQLAQDLHLTTVAEGVETAEQAGLLRRWGCDQLQGFHFSRPVPPESVAAMLRSV